jgi:tRNA A-37 threonylcarbamoyl transferase component Bud32
MSTMAEKQAKLEKKAADKELFKTRILSAVAELKKVEETLRDEYRKAAKGKKEPKIDKILEEIKLKKDAINIVLGEMYQSEQTTRSKT